MNSYMELLKAATDIPIAILSIFFACYLRYKRIRRVEFPLMFLLLGVASLAGVFAHGIHMGDMALRVLWVFLYGIMCATVYVFAKVVLEVSGVEFRAKEKVMMIITVIAFLLCASVRLATGINMIAGFALYAVVVAVIAASAVVRSKENGKPVKLLRIALLILSAALVCQAAAVFYPAFNGAAAAHVMIICSLIVIFVVALEDERKSIIN